MAKLTKQLASSITKILETRGMKEFDLEATWDESLTKKENLDIILGDSEKKALK